MIAAHAEILRMSWFCRRSCCEVAAMSMVMSNWSWLSTRSLARSRWSPTSRKYGASGAGISGCRSRTSTRASRSAARSPASPPGSRASGCRSSRTVTGFHAEDGILQPFQVVRQVFHDVQVAVDEDVADGVQHTQRSGLGQVRVLRQSLPRAARGGITGAHRNRVAGSEETAT